MNECVWVGPLPRTSDLAALKTMGVVAWAGADTAPDTTSAEDLSKLHLSALLDAPWDRALLGISGEEARNIVPLLLGIGLPLERMNLWMDRSFVPLREHSSYRPEPNGEMESLRNRHVGRRAFVIGNGPSLKISDLERLEGDITFASNKIYLAYDQTKWRPTYYTVCDYLVAQNNAEAINQVQTKKIFPRALQQHGCTGVDIAWYNERFENKHFDSWPESIRARADFLFGCDARFGLQGGYTVLYHQLQLAFFMGIRKVYLMGVDFHFAIPAGRSEDARFASSVYRNALSAADEINHFHPDYRSPGERWSMPRLDLQAHAFRSAGKAFGRVGGALVNASRHSELTALPRMDFDELTNTVARL